MTHGSGPLTEAGLRTGTFLKQLGNRIVVHDTVASTNDEAWKLLHAPDADGAVIFADHQSAGRGRLARRWESPRGASVMCSVLLCREVAEIHGPSLGLLAAVACRDAILNATQLACEIKWPNDIMFSERKIAGILVESRHEANRCQGYVLGIGINCLQQRNHFSEVLRDRATSLEIESPAPVDRLAVARALLVELDRWLNPAGRNDTHAVRAAWLQRSAPVGGRIHLLHDGRRFSGQVIDIDPLANLVVQLDEGGRRLFEASTTSVIDGY